MADDTSEERVFVKTGVGKDTIYSRPSEIICQSFPG
jgi:hypothetical protein